ncbi:MAG: RNA-binding transcriptional accessory protein [Gammaproteobacteria bacterium]|nr:RNA-binding transcriptional accessory protein [Gammaproteobacteria bacterium]
MVVQNIISRIANELSVQDAQVQAAVTLLDEGATVPFIARYRKEVTRGLDDAQLRTLQERLVYLRELEERRATVIKSISEQDKLTPELEQQILAADTKTRLEDLYRPYMPKRRTKAQIAREAGLEPLAKALLQDPTLDPATVASDYIDADKDVADIKAALDGAKQILMEDFAEDAELNGKLREHVWQEGSIKSSIIEGKEQEGIKFSDYFDAAESIHKLPSHRALALFRGRSEGILQLNITLPEGEEAHANAGDNIRCQQLIARNFNIENKGRAADEWLQECVKWTWKVKILTRLDNELKLRLRENAENEAIKVFAHNLHDLLMAAPAGARNTMGLDPGFRTGVKVVVVDITGKLLEQATIYPHQPQNQWKQALAILSTLAKKHNVELVSIGNGTASRETDQLALELIKNNPELKLTKIMVSEAGASVYSASSLATEEFPDLDVSLRGAVSIARRLQDPLAELVKIDPKSIGVGQYQHDVNQTQLARSLSDVVEDCVNAVGVNVNTASVSLLSYVSGLNSTLAKNIVAYRDQHGAFQDRKQLLKVARLGDKAFEQSAGFLRIDQGSNPLDRSAVHPEAYPVVENILARTGKRIDDIIGNTNLLRSLNAAEYTDEKFGEPTVRDILQELEKPGRDPRPEFTTASFKEGVEKITDLKLDMILEGVVTNVTNFGAFVDIGVHQDGLVHISALADKFVQNPRDVVKTGDVVKVKVLEVDVNRKRISLTMRLTDSSRDVEKTQRAEPSKPKNRQKQTSTQATQTGNNAFALAFQKAKSN